MTSAAVRQLQHKAAEDFRPPREHASRGKSQQWTEAQDVAQSEPFASMWDLGGEDLFQRIGWRKKSRHLNITEAFQLRTLLFQYLSICCSTWLLQTQGVTQVKTTTASLDPIQWRIGSSERLCLPILKSGHCLIFIGSLSRRSVLASSRLPPF